MSTQEPNDDSSDVECPECGNLFDSIPGMKIHYGSMHEGSISGTLVECSHCGSEFRKNPTEARNSNDHFCDMDCKAEWMPEHRSGEDSHAWGGGSVTVQCEECGTNIERKRCRIKDSEMHFCCLEHKADWQSKHRSGENHSCWDGGGVVVSCDQCGSDVELKEARLDDSENYFCDKECYGDWFSEHRSGKDHPNWIERVDVECEHCGELKSVRPIEAEKQDKFFCGRDCIGAWLSENQTGKDHPNWKGGVLVYGEGWTEEKRESIRERQDRYCAGCGEHESHFSQKLDVHHIQPAQTFDDAQKRNDPSNLIALCRSCHHKSEKQAPLLPDFANAD